MATGIGLRNSESVRRVLRCLGATQPEATLELTGVFTRIGDSDVDSTVTRSLVKRSQIALRRLGMTIQPTGRFDLPTQKALNNLLGPAWRDRSFLDVFESVRSARGTLSLGAFGDVESALKVEHGFNLSSNGVAMATTPDGIYAFKVLQAEANRFADFLGDVSLSVDGAIGPATVALVNSIGGFLWRNYPSSGNRMQDLGAGADVAYIAQHATDIGMRFVMFAQQIGLPQRAGVSYPSPAAPRAPAPAPILALAPPAPGAPQQAGFPLLPALVGGGIILYLATRKKKSSKKRSRQ